MTKSPRQNCTLHTCNNSQMETRALGKSYLEQRSRINHVTACHFSAPNCPLRAVPSPSQGLGSHLEYLKHLEPHSDQRGEGSWSKSGEQENDSPHPTPPQYANIFLLQLAYTKLKAAARLSLCTYAMSFILYLGPENLFSGTKNRSGMGSLGQT